MSETLHRSDDEGKRQVCVCVCAEANVLPILVYLSGWTSNIGGCSSASSMAVMPTDQTSHSSLYPPFSSTAATSGAILRTATGERALSREPHTSTVNDLRPHQYGVPMKDFRRDRVSVI